MSVTIHSEGQPVGYRHGKPIVGWITYKEGDSLLRFTFDRLAMEGSNGQIELSQLKDGEILLSPGAIYK